MDSDSTYIRYAIRACARLIRLVASLQHDLPASMTRVRLCLGFSRISQRKSLGNNDFNFLFIDQPSYLGKLIAVRFGLQGYAANAVLVQLRLIDTPNKADQESASLHDRI